MIMQYKIREMKAAVASLQHVLDEWIASGTIPEVDWKDRVRTLEFQDMVRSRDSILKRIPTYKCTECPDFIEHVCDRLHFLRTY